MRIPFLFRSANLLSRRVWRDLLAASVTVVAGLAGLVVSLTALLLMLPLTLAASGALYLYLRRELQRQGGSRSPIVIDGEYTVVR